jgi:hypothetical protein
MDKKTYGLVGYESDCQKYPRKFTKATDKTFTHAVVVINTRKPDQSDNLVMLVGMSGSFDLARKLQSRADRLHSRGEFETRICETYEI